jgi:hypothetical protein
MGYRSDRLLHFKVLIGLLIGFGAVLALPQRAAAQGQDQQSSEEQPDQEYSNARIVRLSYVEGVVEFQRPGSGWQTAPLNLPIEENFRLRTADGRAEVELESGMVIRLAQNTIVEFTQLALLNGGRATQVNLPSGTAMFSTMVSNDDSFTVTTPNLQVGVSRGGRFRVDVASGNSWVTVLKGDVDVDSGSGNAKLTAGHMLQTSGSDQVNVGSSPAPDDFDEWNLDRDHMLYNGEQAAIPYLNPYSPTDASGTADLSDYGYWTDMAGCGYCWQPYGVTTNWLPFSAGFWMFYGGHGWTWVSSEPWGWLPYHYGHWIYRVGIGWVWAPGPLNHFQGGPVNWVTVNNRLGWVPAAARGAREPVAPLGVIVGSRGANGVITTAERVPVERSAAANVMPARAPAPIFRNREGISYDPSTQTYFNEPRQVSNSDSDGAPAETANVGAPGPMSDGRPSASIRPSIPPRAHPNPVPYTPTHEAAPRPAAPSHPASPPHSSGTAAVHASGGHH